MITLQQISISFGVALSALLVRLFSHSFHATFILTVETIHRALFAMGIITFAMLFILFSLSPKDGTHLIK
jgi:hypothetical protein